MLILLSFPSPEGELAAAHGANVVYRPGLAEADPDTVARELLAVAPDVVVTLTPLPDTALAAWRAARGGARTLVIDASCPDASGTASSGTESSRTDDALRLAERFWI